MIQSPINIRKLAKDIGVSTATVSRALNGKPHVAPEVKFKVIEAVKRLNYSPKIRSTTDRVPVIVEGLVTKDLGLYENLLLARIARLLAERNCHLELFTVEKLADLSEPFSKVAISLAYSKGASRLLSSCETPLVSINNPLEGAFNLCSDHFGGALAATNHLLGLGHRRIGACASHIEGWGRDERLRGFKQALESQGIELDGRLVGDDTIDPSFLNSISTMCKLGVTAIVAMSDEIGILVAHALYQLGRRMPEDISVVSIENQLISHYAVPPQTAISQPIGQMASLAVQKTVGIVRGEAFEPGDAIFESKLVERMSTCGITSRAETP